jgi:type IV pilus assembly protein PilO
MGSPKLDQGRIVSQTNFDLIAYAAPQEKPVASAPGTVAAKAVPGAK